MLRTLMADAPEASLQDPLRGLAQARPAPVDQPLRKCARGHPWERMWTVGRLPCRAAGAPASAQRGLCVASFFNGKSSSTHFPKGGQVALRVLVAELQPLSRRFAPSFLGPAPRIIRDPSRLKQVWSEKLPPLKGGPPQEASLSQSVSPPSVGQGKTNRWVRTPKECFLFRPKAGYAM